MSTTEAIGGECPRCENNHCYVRTGTGTWYTFIACPECGFAYGQHADNVEETGGVVAGAYVFQGLMQAFGKYTMEELREFANDTDEEDLYRVGDTIFNFEDDDDIHLNTCVAQEKVVDDLGPGAREYRNQMENLEA